MAENRLIIELTYSNRGDGDWSHQIDIFRQIEIERLAAEEEILPSGERLDADEIQSLLDDATGDYGEAYKLMAANYVSFFDKLVSSVLKLPLGLTLHQYRGSEDHFMDADCVYATISQQTAGDLLKRSAKNDIASCNPNFPSRRKSWALLSENRSRNGLHSSLAHLSVPKTLFELMP
jgi:hypothetical protein